ncbi:FAD-dependent oxidoreductase [Acinetobacter pseudolwoffii]|uniref:FAD-dependent oxidoreductase n=1 Tax=Acinetobacter pseudolwoffii TaxID=2053287 RepID=UPI0024682D4E|nr:FAD-dependent oxidoreductase [Acinetobacter pseudolwoffii]MDH5818687.1 FAD-dependent oxidoreductase [Acinetobacter pseudolwoffii]
MGRLPLNSLDHDTYDVIVVGAGAVGCASARELAARGYRTLLVDRGDIGEGTSSRSSRMLYSGVGYLAPDFPLWQVPFKLISIWKRFLYARNIMHCRAELVNDIPYRLTKHRFHYPFRKGDRYPHWLIDFGFRMMETLTSRGVPLAYRKVSPNEAVIESAMVRGLSTPLPDIAIFEEYMYDWPERICVDTALDAEKRGALIRTYTKVTQIERSNNLWQITLSEQSPEMKGEVMVRSKMIVNAAGPWVDRIAGGGRNDIKRVLGKKGVNVMVHLPEKWRGQGLEAFSSKGEPFYVFPWREYHFIGPTESLVTDDPDNIQVLDSEIDYILAEANYLFPDLHLTRKDVKHSWCGVRPMSTLDGKTVSLPVRSITDEDMPGLVTMTGSYIMMHRHAGRLAAKSVEKYLGKRGQPANGMTYKPIKVENVNDIIKIITNEHVVRLSDLIRRRLHDGLDPDLGFNRAEELSLILAKTLGWNEQRRLSEIEFFKENTNRVYRKIDA